MADTTIFTLPATIGILSSAVRLATPYLFAAVGEAICPELGRGEPRRGRHHAARRIRRLFRHAHTGSLWLGVLAAMVVGLLMGLLMSVISVTLKAEQGISGIGLYMFGLGLSSLLFKVTVGTVKTVVGFQPVKIPLLGDIPSWARSCFNTACRCTRAFLLVPLAWWLLDKTTWGLKIKAVGQNPAAADSLGVSVNRIRYVSVCLGAVLAGLAGASLSIAMLNLFQDNLTAGHGLHRRGAGLLRRLEPGGHHGRGAPVQLGELVPALDAGAWASRSHPILP